VQFLHSPRWPYRPAVVAEVSLDLTGDGGDGVGVEVFAHAGVEPLGGVDQTHIGHLDEIVTFDAAAAVALGDGFGEAEVEEDDFVDQSLAFGSGGLGGFFEKAPGELVALSIIGAGVVSADRENLSHSKHLFKAKCCGSCLTTTPPKHVLFPLSSGSATVVDAAGERPASALRLPTLRR
jgi:hypothetical protein